MFRDWLRSLRVVSGFSAPSRRRLRRSGASRLSRSMREGQLLETRQVLSAFAVGGETLVNTTTAGNQRTGVPESGNPIGSNPSDNSQAVALDGDGDYVVVWQGETSPGSGIFNVFGRQFTAEGAPSVNGQFQINTTAATEELNMSKPSVAMDSTGNFIVTWASGNGSNDDIYARRYSASGSALTGQFLVSSASPSTTRENRPTIAMSPAGRFVIAWASNQDLSGSTAENIFARAYDSAGSEIRSTFVVNTTLEGRQSNASVAMDGNGDFVIAWDSVTTGVGSSQDGSDFGVYARRFLSTGDGSEFLVNATATTGQQRSPSVAIDHTGNFVVVWHDNPSLNAAAADVYGQRYASNGGTLGSRFLINSETISGTQRNAAVAMDADGDFVVTWESNGSGNYEVYRKSFTELGVAVGPESVVNTFITGNQTNSAVSMDADGDFVVVWTSAPQPLQDNSLEGVYSQRYHENRPPSAVQLTVSSVTVSSVTLPDTTSTTLRVKMADITVVDDDFGVNTLSLAGADASSFEIDGDSLYLKAGEVLDFAVQSTYSVSVQVDDSTVGGSPDASAAFSLILTGNPKGTAEDDGFVITYSGVAPTGSAMVTIITGGIESNLGPFSLSAPLMIEGLGPQDTVTIVGSGIDDVMEPLSTTSFLINGASLTLSGTVGVGAVTLDGAGGNDTYRFDTDSALGTIRLRETEGGGGMDLLDFSATTSRGVSVNLGRTSTQIVNSNLSLVLNSVSAFENVWGGDQDDTLTGNGIANTLLGGSGNDRLAGGGGNDFLGGGAGNDFYLFDADLSLGSDTVEEGADGGTDRLDFGSTTSVGVTVDLSNSGLQVVNGNLSLTIPVGVGLVSTIEVVVGGSQSDSLTGNELANNLYGGAGNDTLIGGGGHDTLIGDVGDDSISGGTGNDAIVGGADNDTYHFDADFPLGRDTVADTSGKDVIDFSPTTSLGVSLDLARSTMQVLNANLSLRIQAGTVLETVLGTAQNDVISGNDADNILVGNAGNDLLSGGLGRDILIGGLGADTLVGGSGDDLLIAGTTSFDSLVVSLNLIRTEWISGNSFATRTANLRNGVGSPLTSLKGPGIGQTVFTDASEDALDGGADDDWGFKAIDDVFQLLVATEELDVL
jgi:hypothetical protein